VTLKYYRFNGANGHEADLQVLIDDFQKKNEGITIKMEIYAWADYFTKLNTVLNAGDAVDVFETNYENFYTYAMNDILYDLDAIVAADKGFNPSMIKAGAFESYKYKGKLYGLCTDFSGVLMYYNKDLFDAAGVAYPTADWTWQDELAASRETDRCRQGHLGNLVAVSSL
jgi:multiple sugar transport system substrate-binding protein